MRRWQGSRQSIRTSPKGRGAPAPESAAPDQLTRVRFNTDDLLLTRFGEAPAPLAEVSAGMLELRRPPAGTVPGRWVVRARRAFPATARPLLDLIPADAAFADVR